MNRFINRAKNKVRKSLCCPIRVFVFHHVSDIRDPFVASERDWTQTDVFKSNILKLKKAYCFIPIEVAYDKLMHDRIRLRKYAVLTTDDGLRTIPYIFPWLETEGIPLTCFINSRYLDGVSCKSQDIDRILKEDPNTDPIDHIKRQYITHAELFNMNSLLLTVGLHGSEHLISTKIPLDSFAANVDLCVSTLSSHPCFRPFFAYPWGIHNVETDRVLQEKGIVPIYVDGMKNYFDNKCIHRECIDNVVI